MQYSPISSLSSSRRIYISYSHRDRSRVEGLALLLRELGHDVFLDRLSIRPGQKWKDRLEEGLAGADVLLVFWTKAAERSVWVRREYESFTASLEERPVVPVLGDETPLTEHLQRHQHLDFAPIVNELLALERTMSEAGADRRTIQNAILTRLEEAGIELSARDRRAMLRMFGAGGILGFLASPLTSVKSVGARLGGGVAELSAAQASIVAIAGLSGVALAAPLQRAISTGASQEAEALGALPATAAPFEIIAGDAERYIKVERWATGRLVSTFLVPSGTTMQTALPVGTYRVKAASGSSWIDETELFGPETRFEVLPDSFMVQAGRPHMVQWIGSGGTDTEIPRDAWWR